MTGHPQSTWKDIRDFLIMIAYIILMCLGMGVASAAMILPIILLSKLA